MTSSDFDRTRCPLFSAVYKVLCERHVVVGNADNTLENVGVPPRGLGPFRARKVEQHRRIVPFDQQDKLFSRARERSVKQFARQQPTVFREYYKYLLELASLRFVRAMPESW